MHESTLFGLFCFTHHHEADLRTRVRLEEVCKVFGSYSETAFLNPFGQYKGSKVNVFGVPGKLVTEVRFIPIWDFSGEAKHLESAIRQMRSQTPPAGSEMK